MFANLLRQLRRSRKRSPLPWDQVPLAIKRMEEDPSCLDTITSPAEDEELLLIGRFIQTYCLADYNARRVLDAIRFLSTPPKDPIAKKLNELDVLTHLRSVLTAWPGDESIRQGITQAVDIIEMHRVHRHNFAHWVIRRFNDYDALLILSLNGPEAVKRDGIPLEDGESKYGYLPIILLKKEMIKLDGHGRYLANLAVHLEKSANNKS